MKDLYSYSLSPDQFATAATRNGSRLLQRMHTGGFVQVLNGVGLGMLLVLGGEALTDGRFLAPAGIPAWAAGAVAVVCIALSLLARHSGVQLALRKSSFAPGPCKLGVDDDGLWLQGPHGESFTRWSGWRSVEEHRELVLLYHDDVHVQPVPFAAFESSQERAEFVDHVRRKIAAHPEVRTGAPARHSAAGAEAEPDAMLPRFAPGFRSLLHAAVRIAMLRPVAPSQLTVTWVQVVGIVLATLVPPLAFAAANLGESGYLAWQQLPSVLFHVPVILVAAIMVAYFIGRSGMVVPILAGTLLAWTVIDFVSLGAWLLLQQAPFGPLAYAFYYVPLAWLAIAVARLALSFIPAPGPRLGWVLVTCALFLALPLAAVHRERSLWSFDYSRNAATPEARTPSMAAAIEETIYRQPEILERELAALQPGRKGVVDVFLVGMAGYGRQDVFMREVDSVAALFRERFDADGHIVKLVNNARTLRDHPVASATSLEASLKRVARVMDGEEDVLVLFLTSHGSQDHEFTVEMRPLELRQITPQMLRQMLDASGIKNRVVIVSACYSGGFVRDLAGEGTLVIAAAAPDRNSFGCTNEAEWTYFGKAYFDEALRKTTSFTRAFEIARPLIEERERAEKFEPSNPQISLGSAMKVKLEELERQLAGPGAPPTVAEVKGP